MDSAYYYQYYKQERTHWWFKIREKIINDQLQQLALPSSPKILNIGAATYKSTELLKNFGHVTSIEFDEDCCQFVRDELNEEIEEGSILDLKFEDDFFDLVCAFDVIEHVEDDTTAIKEMQRVCSKNGILFITVPAYEFLWSSHDEINHHFRRYRLKDLKNIIKDRSLEIIYSSYFNTVLFPFISVFRLCLNIFKKNSESKSDFENFDPKNSSNKLFAFLFNLERPLLKKRYSFPFGVSCLIICKK